MRNSGAGRGAVRRRRTNRKSYEIQAVERRRLLSTITWIGSAGDGNWVTAANWSGGALPTATDDVTIPAGFSAITIAAGTQAVQSLDDASPLTLSGGELDIGAGGATLSANLTLEGGEVHGGSVTFSGGVAMIGTRNAGALVGVTVVGNIDLAQNDEATINVEGGLTLDGSVLVGSAAGTTIGALAFVGNAPQTLDAPSGSTADLIFGGNPYNSIVNATDYAYVPTGPGEPLTLGSGVVVEGKNGGFGGPGLAGEQIINRGVISSAVAGGSISVGNPLLNHGTVSAAQGATLDLANVSGNLGTVPALSDGSTLILGGNYTLDQPITLVGGANLRLGGSWHNATTISETSSTVALGGTFVGADIGTIDRTGGTVEVSGTLDNSGAVLDLNAIGPLTLVEPVTGGGTIRGGTIDGSPDAPLIGAGARSTASRSTATWRAGSPLSTTSYLTERWTSRASWSSRT